MNDEEDALQLLLHHVIQAWRHVYPPQHQ